MAQFPDTIKRVVDQFTKQADHLRSPDYNETLIRIDYINPLMAALDWDMDNRSGYAERTVISQHLEVCALSSTDYEQPRRCPCTGKPGTKL